MSSLDVDGSTCDMKRKEPGKPRTGRHKDLHGGIGYVPPLYVLLSDVSLVGVKEPPQWILGYR